MASKNPPRVPPTPSDPRSRAHENANSANCLLCSPSALGLLFGSSWGLLGRLLGSTWSLLGASWSHIGTSWAPLGLILRCSGRLSCATWGVLGASWANLGVLGHQMAAKWSPNGRQMDAKCMPNWTPQRLPVSTCVFRTPKQLPSGTRLLVSCASVAGWRQYATLVYIYN